MHEPARQPVQPGRKSAKHFLRQPRAEENFAHPDEERQGCERPRRAVAPHRRRQHAARRNAAAGELHAGPSRRHQGDGDPDAGAEQQRKKSEQYARRWREAPCQTPLCMARSTISSALCRLWQFVARREAAQDMDQLIHEGDEENHEAAAVAELRNPQRHRDDALRNVGKLPATARS